MIVAKDRVISLSYDLRIDNTEGKLVESIPEESPLTFIFGSGKLLPKLEDNLKGLGKGDNFDFSIKSIDAYGEFNDNAIVNVPINIFEVDRKIDHDLVKIGNRIPMMDKSGNRLTGTVVEINDSHIKMDFNHPLAGNDLFFKGVITDVRTASEEELTKGLNNGCGGGCGCNCEEGSC